MAESLHWCHTARWENLSDAIWAVWLVCVLGVCDELHKSDAATIDTEYIPAVLVLVLAGVHDEREKLCIRTSKTKWSQGCWEIRLIQRHPEARHGQETEHLVKTSSPAKRWEAKCFHCSHPGPNPKLWAVWRWIDLGYSALSHSRWDTSSVGLLGWIIESLASLV